MSETNVFKLMESMFAEKVQVDAENLKANLKVPIPDFVIDHLIMKFGLKTIAVNNLISLRLGLQEIVKNSVNNYRVKKSKQYKTISNF